LIQLIFIMPNAQPVSIHNPIALLGGLSAHQFMTEYWQKKPLLIRQAMPQFNPLLERGTLFKLAQQEGVESRLIEQHEQGGWSLKHGPFKPKAMPKMSVPNWTLLVQGVDLHDWAVHRMLNQFRFVPDARVDDVMISWASQGGGVGPHFDSYDVFLLQAQGTRRWRIGQPKDLELQDNVPLKILKRFDPDQTFDLEPGDMLYLPPMWTHDGVALSDECMTYSVGFRVPKRNHLASELALRMTDAFEDEALYADAQQVAVSEPARVPPQLQHFARESLELLLKDHASMCCALGEVLTDPKPNVWFEEPASDWNGLDALVLDKRTRMMYDDERIYINGDGFLAEGADAQLMRALADARCLSTEQMGMASEDAKSLLTDWYSAGWLVLQATVL
jgi:50S ribosomal protein L16 3-hydroxylase